MMRKSSRALLLMSIWMALTGIHCQDKQNNIRSAKELEVLVAAFHKESSKRGLDVDVSSKSLHIGFGRIDSKAGSCKPNSNPKTVTLDSLLWKALSAQQKEMLVYHELAHCLLDKKHNNDTLRFGECKSWMRENDSRCTTNMINAEWREYYIDELFATEVLASPIWYNIHEKPGPAQSSNRVANIIVQTKSNALQFDSSFFNSGGDWSIRINFLEPININGSLGITINEYTIWLAGYISLSTPYDTVVSRALTLNQYEFQRDRNILQWDLLKSSDKKKEVSIKKSGKVLFIFFGSDLRQCVPVAENKITIHGYSAFSKENAYSITAYRL